MWTVSLPVTLVNASDRNPGLQAVDIIGWIIWVIGFSIEATADQQKLQFKNSPENRGKWCSVGTWKYSRHPNYFGEVSTTGPLFHSVLQFVLGNMSWKNERKKEKRYLILYININVYVLYFL